MWTPPHGYVYKLTPEEIKAYWPNLKLQTNFHFTSEWKRAYNCVGWAVRSINMDIDMLWFRDKHKLDPNTLDHTAKGYGECLKKYYNFEYCEFDELKYEEGIDKIALYEDKNGDFKHVARLLQNGHWTSKMGKYEDIEHYNMDAIKGDEYGIPVLYMKRSVI